MTIYKKYPNGLRLVIEKMEGLMSVSCGVLVKTGSANENEFDNGISHFIEHVMFKGTQKRSAFEISDYIDRIGAQINAFTSKELTCYYTKSTYEHTNECLEVLSDIFFNSQFIEEELEKEKGVILEEINMSEDTPEDLLFDLLAQSFYGNKGLGQTILGPAENIKKFTKADIKAYMDKYYTADNVIISIAGNVDVQDAQRYVEEFFVNNLSTRKGLSYQKTIPCIPQNLCKQKSIEQSHIGLCMPTFAVNDDRCDALAIANIILGGGMSSRLFQTIRERLGLAYSVYSYSSLYQGQGLLEVYAGVNPTQRDLAVEKIIEEIKKFKNGGVTEQEFYRAKEQVKSSIILGRESTSSQMILSAKYILFLDKTFDFNERLKSVNEITIKQVNDAINSTFDLTKMSTATVGPQDCCLTCKI